MILLSINLKQHFLFRLLLAVLLFSGFDSTGQKQTRIGEWQLHVPYRQGKAVEEAGDKIYVAVEQGLFYYDKAFNATETLTKNDGLRDQSINTIRYDETTKTLVIAYAGTYVDLLQENKITSISDIFRRNIPGGKTLNSVFIYQKQAYISSSFGIVVLDLVKQEIRATYSNLGATGEQLNVQATAVLNDSIYAVTNTGVLAASLSGPNLQDYRNWQNKSQGLPAPGSKAHLAAFNGNLYLGTNTNGIYKLANGQWQATALAKELPVLALRSSTDYLVITTPSKIVLLDKAGKVTEVVQNQLTAPKDALVGRDKKLWVADGVRGLVQLLPDGTQPVAFAPAGPYSGTGFKIYALNGKVYVFSGGYNASYSASNNTSGFYTYENGSWESFNRTIILTFPPVADLVSGVINPVTNKLYVASYGGGLLEWDGKTFTVYNAANGPLLSTVNSSEVRITDVAIDHAGKVWVVNKNQKQDSPGLFALPPDKTWKVYTIPGVTDGSNLEQILIDDFGNKWLSVSRQGNSSSGLIVYDETTQQVRKLSAGTGFGNLPDGNVYAMAKDLNGDIWVGTGKGVAVFYSPDAVFATQNFDAHIPIFNRRRLLDEQLVRTIAIDGANRKWIGTDNGLWVFSPDGDELVHQFTTENSPLPSNQILSVAVEHKTGQVFVATAAGLASYRAGVTITEGKPACAVVFPNPVQRNYTGVVAISELPNNAEVHITDIAGKLIYKTRATGGTVTWNVQDYNGNRAKAGVYLVMSSDADGKQTCITKIAVLQ